MFNTKLTQSIAEAAKKVMDEELKGQQHKIDKNKNNKIDAHDFKLLRKEENVEEAMQKADVPAYLRKQQGEKPLTMADVKGPRKDSISSKENLAKARNEEVEQVTEADVEKTATGMKVYGSSYGNSVRARREQIKKSVDTVKGPKMKDIASIEAEKKTKKKFSEMVESYVESGIKGLFESFVKEEVTNDQFKKELDKQQAKADGKAPQADVAKAAVQAVKNEEVEQLDELSPGTLKSYVNKAKPEVKAAKAERADARDAGDGKTANDAFQMAKKRTAGIKQAKAKLNAEEVEQVEERSLTEPEMKKKEEVVMSMKKGLQGFKDRYGADAKSVMYATATRIAKKD
jgi:hypothetical protein